MTARVTVNCATIITLICALSRLDHGVAQDLSTGIGDIRRICSSEEFQCRDSRCIPSELLCDGKPDCKDNSDEVQSECSKPELLCPDYVFRCAYGACVDGDATCNGVKDCFDNSDEALLRCPGIISSDKSGNGVCSTLQHRCENGQCIDATALCDGQVDCKDGSDETIRVCGSFSCPPMVFRCNYGACIDADKKCDHKRDCADGSDEDSGLCSALTTNEPIKPITEKNTTTTTEPTPSQPSGCPGPAQPRNGQWKVHRSSCPDNVECVSLQDVPLDPGTALVYSCDTGYKIRGQNEVYCAKQGKWSSKPVCEKIKCPTLAHPSLVIESCWFHTNSTNCGVPVLPGAYARLSCASGYQEDRSGHIRRNRDVLCKDDGHWDPEPIRCTPVCGTTGSSGPAYPRIANGTVANLTEFPWHATLYRQETKNGPKVFKCGATIIQPNVLITAAHCVYDEVLRIVQPATTFYVATGNIMQDFDTIFHDRRVVRKRQVKEIYINCNYRGLTGHYALDIALLELIEPFTLSNVLLPICLDWHSTDERVLELGAVGKVAGFGRTEFGKPSYILLTVEVPFVSQSNCTSAGERTNTQMYVTDDKFCGGYANGSTVCDGDSGGGLVFKTGNLWYLRGITSVGLGADTSTGEKTCDIFNYTLFTKLSKHLTWIRDMMLYVQSGQSYIPCYISSHR